MSKSSTPELGEEKFKSKIGGQAVIEGVMMRGIDKASMANRLPGGEIDLEVWPIRGGKDLPWYRKGPFVRGVFEPRRVASANKQPVRAEFREAPRHCQTDSA